MLSCESCGVAWLGVGVAAVEQDLDECDEVCDDWDGCDGGCNDDDDVCWDGIAVARLAIASMRFGFARFRGPIALNNTGG